MSLYGLTGILQALNGILQLLCKLRQQPPSWDSQGFSLVFQRFMDPVRNGSFLLFNVMSLSLHSGEGELI